jgi:hypothetical protein
MSGSTNLDLLRTVDERLHYIRGKGWTVAVHNDYRIDGVEMTFWLFTKIDHAVKGEGDSDLEALGIVIEGIQEIEAKQEEQVRQVTRMRELENALRPFAKAAEELDRSDEGWDDRARVRNSWFFNDADVKRAAEALRVRSQGT